MSVFAGSERFLIDWNDVYFADREPAPEDDITSYVSFCSYAYGLNVLNNPDAFTFTSLGGSIKLNRDFEGIDERQLLRPHVMRHMIDDRIVVECIALPVRDRSMVLISRNQALLRDPVDLTYTESVKDFTLWADALRYVGADPGRLQIFNDYDVRGGLHLEQGFSQFINDFMTFGGGYAFEDRLGRLNFAAARSRLADNPNTFMNKTHVDMFDIDISSKEGIVRNEARTTILRPRFSREVVRTIDFALTANGFRDFYVASPEDKIAGNWDVKITKPTILPAELTTDVLSTSGSGFRFSAFNAGASDLDVTVEVFATTYSVIAQENLNELRVVSSVTYGRQPLERFPDWGADTRPVNEELTRLEQPLRVAKIEFPLMPEVLPNGQRRVVGNPIEWLDYDVGDIVRVRDDDTVVDMMIGRIVVQSGGAFVMQYHLLEQPLDVDAYHRNWILDDDSYILGVNTFLTDPTPRLGNYLTLDGQYVTLNGENLYFEPYNLLVLDDEYVTLDGQELYFSLN